MVDLRIQTGHTCKSAAQVLPWTVRSTSGGRTMFEEAQLYSPVSTGDDGEVTVHLAHDHPGANDPVYRQRRAEIAAAALAWRPGDPSPRIRYNAAEENVWRTVCRELEPKHERYAVREFREALARVDLPRDHVPGLDEVTARVE